VLKAEQAAAAAAVFKFPLAPLGCSGLSSAALLAAGSGLQGGSAAAHLPLELHFRGKLETGAPGAPAEAGSKAKKGRRSRTGCVGEKPGKRVIGLQRRKGGGYEDMQRETDGGGIDGGVDGTDGQDDIVTLCFFSAG
ncbi:hypothetical protein JD844_012739, partial [Phrynosoma platyrhinos]